MSSLDMESLGDFHKFLEQREAGRKPLPGTILMARLDGKGFSRVTEALEKPFDLDFVEIMDLTAKSLLDFSQASIVYTQSDEITLVWADHTKAPFEGKYQKICSVLAGYASSVFNMLVQGGDLVESIGSLCLFDCRVWEVPTLARAAENLLWRGLDAERNSVSMLASYHFSHKALLGVNTKGRLKMLGEEGILWADLPDRIKRGAFFRKSTMLKYLTEEELKGIPETHRPTAPIPRKVIVPLELPKLTSIGNLEQVLFNFAPVMLLDQPEGVHDNAYI